MADLSNIFIGDKVVQKAYLNNGLLFQADGWNNTPVSAQKQYYTSTGGTGAGINGAFDKNNDLIVISLAGTEGMSYLTFSKIDKNTGEKKYSTQSNIMPVLNKMIVNTGNVTPTNYPIYINKDGIIYSVVSGAYPRDYSRASIWLVIAVDNGKSFNIKTVDLTDDANILPHGNSTYCLALLDEDYFYVQHIEGNTYFTYKVDYNYTAGEILEDHLYYVSMCTNPNIDNIYAIDNSTNLYSIDKASGKSTLLVSKLFNVNRVNHMVLDNMNNLYFYQSSNGCGDSNAGGQATWVYKYSTVNKTFTNFNMQVWNVDGSTTTNNMYYTNVCSLAVDSKYNVLVTGILPASSTVSGTNYMYSAKTYQPNGTYSWDTCYYRNDVDNSAEQVTVCVDKYDNIYYIFRDNSGSLRVLKYITVEKTS